MRLNGNKLMVLQERLVNLLQIEAVMLVPG